MRISSVFSYYGGKSKIIDRYPVPTQDLVIEPFAGAAAYAWRWRDHQVWINELDTRTFSIWDFLTSKDALDWIEGTIPASVVAGMRISDLVPDDAPDGLRELMRAEANQGTQGARGIHDQITSMAAHCWPRLLPKMQIVVPQITHWVVTNGSYDDLPDEQATWFIDPPYANVAGSRYRQSAINYDDLGAWCRTRSGQVIVCENLGATWLPFDPFSHKKVGISSRYQKADAQEVMWHAQSR